MSDLAMRWCYFADYEILIGGKLRVWGQSTIVYSVVDASTFDPADLLRRMRQQVADEHGVERDEVRIRSLNRV